MVDLLTADIDTRVEAPICGSREKFLLDRFRRLRHVPAELKAFARFFNG
jgi:hypothetical protein